MTTILRPKTQGDRSRHQTDTIGGSSKNGEGRNTLEESSLEKIKKKAS